jgi:hypothetical protein
MPHVLKGVAPSVAGKLLRKHDAFLIRWDENFDGYTESEWWHVIKDSLETMDSLSASTRSKVRRGLRRYLCAPCSRAAVIAEGFPVYASAYKRYTTFEPCLDESRFIEAIYQLPVETEFWSVRDLDSGRLVAFSENVVRDNSCLYNTIWFTPDGLKKYSSYALFHEMNKYYLNDVGLKYVSDGTRSISHQTNIHEFLQAKFGFRKSYSRLHVIYSKWLFPLVVLLYPFYFFLRLMPGSLFRKISVILEQERIRRSCNRLPEIT